MKKEKKYKKVKLTKTEVRRIYTAANKIEKGDNIYSCHALTGPRERSDESKLVKKYAEFYGKYHYEAWFKCNDENSKAARVMLLVNFAEVCK